MGGERLMVKQLLDFDPTEQVLEDLVIGWKAIAHAVGFSEDTVQRALERHEAKLPRWGPATSSRSPVFLPRRKILVLRRLVMGPL